MISSQAKKKPCLADASSCVGCLACCNVCPAGAIEPYFGKDGHQYVRIDDSKCIGCLKCEKLCTSLRTNYGENIIDGTCIYAGWSNNKEERAHATSGGIFAAIAKSIISQGGVVIGAKLEGAACKHILISDIEQIRELQGSKYMQCSMKDVYKDIAAHIAKGKVLFTGIGCQVSAVLTFFENSPHKNNLYVIDIICGGIPSNVLIERFCADDRTILSFRDKEKYQLVFRDNDGEHTEIRRNLPLDGFACEMTNRHSCYDCQYAFLHRKANLTIGDLWDYSIVSEEHGLGVSMVLAHDERGSELLSMSDIHLEKISWVAVLSNIRVACGKTVKFRPRRQLEKNIDTLNSESFRKLYCMDIEPKDGYLFAFKIYRYFVNKVFKAVQRNKIKKIISAPAK